MTNMYKVPMLGLCAFLLLVEHLRADGADAIVVKTTLGKVRGFYEQEGNTLWRTYLGIPFARPPIDDLRFKRPEAMSPWNNIRAATKFSPACIQYRNISLPGFIIKLVNPDYGMSEDCLYLNIWVPAKDPNVPKAVMVWIYGGSFLAGTSTVESYNGKKLAESQDVIVVSLNYRLGPLGFLFNGKDTAPGNMGLLDQQMALRWVKDNIAAFGGDPGRITIFGESAGAASVSYHLLAEGSNDLFKNAILQSGVAISTWAYKTPASAKKMSTDFARSMGCADSEDKECLLKLSAMTISESPATVLPTMDGLFIKEEPVKLLKEGKVKPTDVLMGFTKNEGHLTTGILFPEILDIMQTNKPVAKELYDRMIEAAVIDRLGKTNKVINEAVKFQYEIFNWKKNITYIDTVDEIIGDESMNCDVVEFAKYFVQSGGRVYMYVLSHRPSNVPVPEWMGVTHGLDIYYVFNNTNFLFTREELQLSEKIMSYWANLAKSGHPGLSTWPYYTDEAGEYLNLDITDTMTSAHGLRDQQCYFWNHYVPKLESELDEYPDGSTGKTAPRNVPSITTWCLYFLVTIGYINSIL